MRSHAIYKELIERCEEALRAGHRHLAAQSLQELSPSKVPRVWRLPLANLCRRARLLALGLRLLTPVVRNQEAIREPGASADEKAEYAILLERCGAGREALELLKPLDPKQTPEVRIARVHCYFGMWNYELAVPELQEYLRQPRTPFLATVSRLNLAAAFIALGRLDEAPGFIEQVIADAGKMKNQKLQGNALELLAQIHVARNDRAAAAKALQEAVPLLGVGSTDLLFVEKWRAVMDAKQTGAVEPILAVRKKALGMRHWETVRDCDLRALEVKFDLEPFHYLYFGTPYQAYRKKIVGLLGHAPSAAHLTLGKEGARCFDLENGTLEGGEDLRKAGKVHGLFEILMRDFYRPISLGGLFSELFRDEYFNIDTSPNRVMQIMTRARRWIRENDLPLSITARDGAFTCSIDGELSVRVLAERRMADPHAERVRALRHRYGENAFTSEDGCDVLGLSRTAFRNFIALAIEAGQIEKYGASTATVYYLTRQAA